MTKQIELNLQKILLIVEVDNCDITIDKYGIHFYFLRSSKQFIPGNFHQVCKGSELTEEIAKGLVNNILCEMGIEAFENYNVTEKDLEQNHWAGVSETALQSFISAIDAKGKIWGKYEKPTNINGDTPRDLLDNFWNDLSTFNPEKALIFEIIE